jgi:hypothetical protein
MEKAASNVVWKLGDAEAMFCAYGKSQCISEEKGCLCSECEVFKEFQPGPGYFCMKTGGK